MKNLIVILLSVLVIPLAFAIDLKTARTKGLVGETANGHIAAIHSKVSPEVEKLIVEINSKRINKFKAIAAKNKSDIKTVQDSVHKKIIHGLKSGSFYQNAKGAWIRKK